LGQLITMKTAECERVEPWGHHFDSICAVRVISVEPLPKGKNKLVVIDAGDKGQRSVVCGAPNVRPDMIAAWIPPGTRIEDNEVGIAVIQGARSEGMLASARELGISADHDGLLELSLKPGERLESIKPDWIIEIDNKSLTHRPDLWGHFGMAREVATITSGRLVDPVRLEVIPPGDAAIGVEIEDHVLCPRYSALVTENVKVAPSPLWLQARLEAIGLNPINNIVDVTNYVLAELPQPMHAFDADKLEGKAIFVRRARSEELLAALNGQSYTLTSDDLVIADSRGAVAIAGVIGGSDTAISDTTTRIVLESANFHAATVRLTSSRHKLRTDASMRFEKSLDPENTVRGLARVVELLREICPGARIVGGLADNWIGPPLPITIEISVEFINRRLGESLTENRVRSILEALGFRVTTTSPGHFSVIVPSWRATKDISLREDLVEEIGRIVGYEEITPAIPLLPAVVPYSDPMRPYLRSVRQQLTAQGFTEVYNYSFVNESQWQRFGFAADDHIAVSNPIASELTHMRRSLLPGVFDNILRNVRNFREFRLFEIGREIHPQPESLPKEEEHTVAVIFGPHTDEQDFFEGKRVVECVFPGAVLRGAKALAWEHPARAAEIRWHGELIGRLFELHPALLESEGVEGRAVLFDVDLQIAQALAETPKEYRPLRRYPTSAFDLSIVTELRKPVADIQDELVRLGADAIVSIEFVRQYAGPPLGSGQKSVSYRLEAGAPDRTLTSEETSEIRARIIEGMQRAGYDLRV
jgi:phenylalanyl-tRNA synthetase beta chain